MVEAYSSIEYEEFQINDNFTRFEFSSSYVIYIYIERERQTDRDRGVLKLMHSY